MIGWISNFDSMLFGLLVMFTVAAFFQFKQSQTDQARIRAEADLASTRDRLEQQIRELQSRIGQLQKELAQRLDPAIRQELEAKIASLRAELSGLRAENVRLQRELTDLQRIHREYVAKFPGKHEQPPGVRKELIGLVGDLKKVVLVVDRSGSMGRDNLWKPALAVISSWLDFVEVDQCALVVFSSKSDVFPIDGSYLDFRGPEAAANRAKLNKVLAEIQPSGGTFTRGALIDAYAHAGVDTIILFTDGEPNDGNSDKIDLAEVEKIYRLIDEHPGVRINVVGLGNYFGPELSKFLRTVKEKSQGTFLGR